MLWCLFKLLQSSLLNLLDLLLDEPQVFQYAHQLTKCVGRKRFACWRAQGANAFRRIAQSSDLNPRMPCRMHSALIRFDRPRALPDQLFALAVWPFRILLLNCRNRHHAAVSLLTT